MANINWYSLTERDKEKARKYAEQVRKDKGRFKSTNLMNNDSHYLGKLGEIIYSKWFGREEPNFTTSKFEGDRGYDFNGLIDIKTTTRYIKPFLFELPSKIKTSHTYVLVALDVERSQGYLVGQIKGNQLQHQLVPNYKGLGPRLMASKKTLKPLILTSHKQSSGTSPIEDSQEEI